METTKQDPMEILAGFRDNPFYRWSIDHITYDHHVTDDFDFYLTETAVHDGTVYSSTELIRRVFSSLININTVEPRDEEYLPAGESHYIVGDLIREVEDVMIEGKCPGIREEYRLMVKRRYVPGIED